MSRETRAANRLGLAHLLAHSPHPLRSRIAWRLMAWAVRLDPRIYTLVVGLDGSPMPARVGDLISHGFGIISQQLLTLGAQEHAVREAAAAIDRARAGTAGQEAP